MYDIAIIGLGPAGATLARLLSKDFRVIAIDKKQEAGDLGFHKPCGGLLAPDAQKELARFNLTLPKSIIVDPQIFSVKTVDLTTNITRYYQRHYINIDRHKFDLWLKSLIPESVEVYSSSVCERIERFEKGFRIWFSDGEGKKSVEAKFLVGADGANSLVRRTIKPKWKIRRYMAIQQWFQDTHQTPFYSCIFDNKRTDCYSWSISKDGYFIFGGAFPPKNSRQAFEEQKQELEKHDFKFGEVLKTEACQVLRPASFLEFCCGQDNAFLLGEAAGFISPSSLEGISYALNSAVLLGEVLNSRCDDPAGKYKSATRRLRLRLLGKILKSPFMYNQSLRSMVMKSKLASIEIIDGYK